MHGNDFLDVIPVRAAHGEPRSQVAFGALADGRFIIVVYRWIDQVTVQPITAYEVPE